MPSSSQHEPLHVIETTVRTNAQLRRILGGMPVAMQGDLVDELNRLSSVPCAQFTGPFSGKTPIKISGEDAGTVGEPNVDVIVKHSQPSNFGRGEATVYDPDYRDGREVPGEKVKLDWGYHYESPIANALFIGKDVRIELYKIAIYTKDGHFDWHRDSTRSDDHQATCLIALNTSWEGGDFIVRRAGVETTIDMHPKKEMYDGKEYVDLGAVAFYTDTEHKVMPVTAGVRIILQYDVFVTGPAISKKEVDNVIFAKHYKHYVPVHSSADDTTSVERIRAAIEEKLKSESAVAFSMQYLYRQASILPKYLKGNDALLYNALSEQFDISLHAVVLHGASNYEGDWEDHFAVLFGSKPQIMGQQGGEGGGDGDLNNGEDDSDWDEYVEQRYRAKKDKDGITFHLHSTPDIKRISKQDFIEYTRQ